MLRLLMYLVPLALTDSYEGSRYQFARELTLGQSGPFGYTVRIVPSHPGLAGFAELGLVATA